MTNKNAGTIAACEKEMGPGRDDHPSGAERRVGGGPDGIACRIPMPKWDERNDGKPDGFRCAMTNIDF
jgi:hypothetical protein